MIIGFIQPADLAEWWPRLKPHIDKIVSGSSGRYSPLVLYQAVLAKEYWLGAVMDGEEIKAVFVAVPIHWKTGLVELEMRAAAGADLDEWVHLVADLADYAKRLGFDRIIAAARPGWSRAVKKYGWRMKHVFLELDLHNVPG